MPMKNPAPASKGGRRSADSYGSPSKSKGADRYANPAMKSKGVKKATYKSGGLYSTGRAIAMAPGTKKKAQKPADRFGNPMSKGAKRVTSPMPSKGPNKNTNKKYK